MIERKFLLLYQPFVAQASSFPQVRVLRDKAGAAAFCLLDQIFEMLMNSVGVVIYQLGRRAVREEAWSSVAPLGIHQLLFQLNKIQTLI